MHVPIQIVMAFKVDCNLNISHLIFEQIGSFPFQDTTKHERQKEEFEREYDKSKTRISKLDIKLTDLAT